MELKCVVFGCRNSFFTLENNKIGCQFFHFPLNNFDLCGRWLEKLYLVGWIPGPESLVCEEHFSAAEVDILGDKKVLKPDAIPNLVCDWSYLTCACENISEDEPDSIEDHLKLPHEVLRCRICAKSISSERAIHIYSKGERIIEKIMACIPIPLKIEDNLPKHLCRACLSDLNISYRMLVRAIESEKLFHGAIHKSRGKPNEKGIVETNITLDIQDTQTSCVVCNEFFENVRNLKEHLEEKHVLVYQNEELTTFEKKDQNKQWKNYSEQENDDVSQTTENLHSINSDTIEVPTPYLHQLVTVIQDESPAKSESEFVVENDYFGCQMCSTIYKSIDQLNKHIDETHIESIILESDSSLEDQRNEISLHNKIETPLNTIIKAQAPANFIDQTHSCTICSAIFCSLASLNRHRKDVHRTVLFDPDQLISKHICNNCGRKFNAKVSLEVHQRVHSGERPYKCAVCSRAFKSKANLKQHGLVHNGIRKYKCSICDKTFARKIFIENHMRVHTGERPFVCDICDNRYTQIGDMRRHRMRHVEAKPMNSQM